MKPNTAPQNGDDTDPTRRFERELYDLIADSFARGAVIDQTWEVTTPVSGAPNWQVTIEKTYSDEEPSYEPRLLDE